MKIIWIDGTETQHIPKISFEGNMITLYFTKESEAGKQVDISFIDKIVTEE